MIPFRYLPLLILFLFTTTNSFGQSLDSFPATRAEFIETMEAFMTSSKRDVMEEIFEEFEDQFKGGLFTEEDFPIIRKTCDMMLQQKMKASPYFSNYLQSLVRVKKTEQGEANFQDLHTVLQAMLADIENRKLKPYQDFLEFTLPFYEFNALRYSKNGVTWTAEAEGFQLLYEEKMPLVKYEKLHLIASRKQDTIRILETQGSYYPVDDKWMGSGGTVNWGRFGLEEEIYCVLGDYTIETKKSLYKVGEVDLYHPDLFPNGAIKGSFIDKVVTQNRATEGSYPRFESTEDILQIDNIGEGITYVGGFRLHGTTVYGYGTKENQATIRINDGNNKLAFKGSTDLFVIRKGERLAGEGVESAIYFGQDSIYHPSVNVKFNIPKRKLNLQRGKRGSDRNPFFNSLYRMNIDSDQIDWFMDNDSLLIGQQVINISRKKEVTFESLNFFSEGDYRRLQNISSTNPISMLKVISEREGLRVLDANMVASKFNSRFDASSIQSLLYDLVAGGFINYDKENEDIIIKDKIIHYADASQEKTDFDYLRISSKTDSVNAVMSLKTKDMHTTGVSGVQFSAKQRVALRPTQGNIIIKENRNMDFDGRMFAGFAVMEGKDYSFEYDKNQVEMDSIRYLDLFVPTGAIDEDGNPIALSIASRIEHTNGILLIDAPNNKSGKEDIPLFPSFNSKGSSYVYYDNSDTQGGSYKRDSFYFELDKFSFNSLDNFVREDLSFNGKMVSADIFPEFKETLVLREEDESLGFVAETPVDGYPTYLGKGTYKGGIDLSNQGFLGKGTLNYLQASFESEDIVFKPKQLNATARRFDLEEDRNGTPEVPQAVGLDVSIDWRPYQDSMYVRSKERPFDLFKDELHALEGTLILTPGGLKGNGKFMWDKGILNSELMSFGAFSVDADTANLQIFAFGSDDFAFDTKNVQATLDFDEQEGRIKANSDELSTTMPYNQYQTSVNEFIWDMKEETITFKSEEGKRGQFRSIHPDQDSLTFEGETALYDLKTNELKIGGVPFIQTSDAFVYTADGNVEIQKGGVMTTLENAKIVANTENKYHVINRATVDVLGKKEYKASGFYEYNIGDKKQEIEFADIVGTRVGKGKRSEKKTVTRATGKVEDTANFYIDHKTEFRGTISLSAESKNLQFDGFAKLDAPTMPNPNWFTVKFEGDKNDLAISYDTPKNYKGEPLFTGLYLSKETAQAYPRVMMPLSFRKDRPILEAKGLFKYHKVRDEFYFGDSLKIVDNAAKGNMLTYSNKDGKVSVEGALNIGSGLDYMSVQAAGIAQTSFDTGGGEEIENVSPEVIAQMMAGIDMIIPEKLLKIMITDLKASSFDAKAIDYLKDERFYDRALAEFIPDNKDYNQSVEKMKNLGLELPKKYDKFAFFFSNLPMKWNADYQSFVSAQDKLGLSSVNGVSINRWLSCHVEFKMPSNEDDRVYIYIKSPSEFYYFFGYKQGVLSVVSNNVLFNDVILEMKKKDLIKKMDDGEFYEIQLVEPGSAQMFVNRIKAAR